MESSLKLLAIVGPTASGKSQLAMQVALSLEAEIVCADSRTIYKGMDIGTAKPSKQDRAIVKHWGLDLIDPGELYSAARYQQYAAKVIENVKSQNKLSILVGGTGLYIDSVIYDFSFIPPDNGSSKLMLEELDIDELHKIISQNGYPLPYNSSNKRHLIRTIERKGKVGSSKIIAKNTLVIGILPSDEVLRQNIKKRADSMFENGVINETSRLIDEFGRQAILASGGYIYKICIQVLDGEINEAQAIELVSTADWQYARRQRTWFKRNKDIRWFIDVKSAYLHLESLLNT
jgi:tRNA dimethylallyltransferase